MGNLFECLSLPMNFPSPDSKRAPALETIAQLLQCCWLIGVFFNQRIFLGKTLIFGVKVWNRDFANESLRLQISVSGFKSFNFLVPKKRAWLRVKCLEETFCCKRDCLSWEMTRCLCAVSFSLRLTRFGLLEWKFRVSSADSSGSFTRGLGG